jgi:hypothetical protein
MKEERGMVATANLSGANMSGANLSGQANAPLDATAQFLTFEPGMYAVDFHAPRPMLTHVGLPMPCARLDAMAPSIALQGRAVISMMSESGFLFHGDLPAFVRVVGGTAGVLLTIYKSAGGMPSPELRIRYIRDDLQFQPVPAATDHAPAAGEPLPLAEGALATQLLVHAQERGDVVAGAGEWAGTPGSRLLLEGFAVMVDPQTGVGSEELEYQAILGDGWNTPWFAAGEFCGSRGLALPILGLRVRLNGHAAGLYQCTYWGSFVGPGEVGPIADGEACEADGQPMDALRILITSKTPPPAAAAPPAGASASDQVGPKSGTGGAGERKRRRPKE